MSIYEVTHTDPHYGKAILDGVRATYDEALALCRTHREQDIKLGINPHLYKVTMAGSAPQLTH